MKFRKSPRLFKSAFATGAALCAFAIVGSKTNDAFAQTFNSGSTGADGALDLTGKPSGTVVDFDPKALGIDPEGDNVFHFTTITIPSGVTLRMSAKWTNGPVYWLATGAVNIAGVVNLSGEAGAARTQSMVLRTPAIPGPGGYPGGVGGNHSATSRGLAQAGSGPGGGQGAPGAADMLGFGATLTLSTFLVPLSGGSGGGGGSTGEYEWWGGGGGAGGGAILIASSTSIGVTGQILAVGGRGGTGNPTGGGCNGFQYAGAGGGGGAIRLTSATISGGGTLAVDGGASGGTNGGYNCGKEPYGASGRIRLEAYQQNWGYAIRGNYTTGSPLNSYVPTTPPPSLQVISVGGVSVRPDPTGSFDAADVTINSNAATAVTIQAKYVPVGTVPTLYVFSLEGKDQILQATPLSGSYELSTATAQVLFPSGFTRGYVRAKWTPAP